MDRMAKFTGEDWSRLGDFVRRRRTALGWTQDELAERAEVSINTVGNVERGQRSRELNLSKIARALGWVSDSFWLILEGGHPMIADDTAAPVEEEAIQIQRPPSISNEEWARLRSDPRVIAELIADLEKYLRWSGGNR